MPFNVQTFKTRTLTAVIFAAVMLVGLFWNWWSFFILFTIIHLGCWLEYLKLIEKIYNTEIERVIKWLFAVCGFVFVATLNNPYLITQLTREIFSPEFDLKWVVWFFLLLCLLTFVFQNKKTKLKAKWACFGGFLYIAIPVLLLFNLWNKPLPLEGDLFILKYEYIFPAAIIFSIWINDTMAYIVGSIIGKTPFSKISPKKTWEGTAGGALLCVTVIGLIAYFTNYLSVKDAVIIAALSAIFGTLGDLFESKLKRLAGVKDSGSFMPGHGGFLDRFDSLLFAVPVVWLYVMFFVK